MSLKFSIKPGSNQNSQDTDQIWRKPDTKMELQYSQIQEDVLDIKYFVCSGQIRHETDKVSPLDQLAYNAANQCAGSQKEK